MRTKSVLFVSLLILLQPVILAETADTAQDKHQVIHEECIEETNISPHHINTKIDLLCVKKTAGLEIENDLSGVLESCNTYMIEKKVEKLPSPDPFIRKNKVSKLYDVLQVSERCLEAKLHSVLEIEKQSNEQNERKGIGDDLPEPNEDDDTDSEPKNESENEAPTETPGGGPDNISVDNDVVKKEIVKEETLSFGVFEDMLQRFWSGQNMIKGWVKSNFARQSRVEQLEQENERLEERLAEQQKQLDMMEQQIDKIAEKQQMEQEMEIDADDIGEIMAKHGYDRYEAEGQSCEVMEISGRKKVICAQ